MPPRHLFGHRSVGCSRTVERRRNEPHPYSVPACWFLNTTVIIRSAVALKAALKSKLAEPPRVCRRLICLSYAAMAG